MSHVVIPASSHYCSVLQLVLGFKLRCLCIYDLLTQNKQYWERWHKPAPGKLGQRAGVQGQPGPHETRLKNPNKPSPQDRKSLQSTFSSDFIPLPRGRKTHQKDRIISTNTYNHSYAWDASAAMYGYIKTRRPCTGTPDPHRSCQRTLSPHHFPIA